MLLQLNKGRGKSLKILGGFSQVFAFACPLTNHRFEVLSDTSDSMTQCLTHTTQSVEPLELLVVGIMPMGNRNL